MHMKAILRVAAGGLIGLAVLTASVWGALALWFALPAPDLVRALTALGFALLGIAGLLGALLRRQVIRPLAPFSIAFIALIGWWSTIEPSNERAWQRDVAQLHTIFGGKNPHPNFLVGGVPSPIDLDSDSAINSARLSTVQNIITQMREFVDQVYVPDTLAIASFYKDWGARGEGLGNFLTYGDFPETGMDDPASFLIPSGAILDRDITTIHEVDMNAADEIQERAFWIRRRDYPPRLNFLAGLETHTGRAQSVFIAGDQDSAYRSVGPNLCTVPGRRRFQGRSCSSASLG